MLMLSVLSESFCITGKYGIEFPRTQRREGADTVSDVKNECMLNRSITGAVFNVCVFECEG